ncbi:MAG: dipeptide ABC transporter ATP-binding protein [Desulfofustis sp.]|nr:dipeptide ABC transporter ATP-binding protein [Desulfofustis sp.]
MNAPLLAIKDLNGWIDEYPGTRKNREPLRLLHDVTLTIGQSQTVALVGESGSGKSLTALSILRLLEENTPIRISGSIRFEDRDLLTLPPEAIRRIRGNRIAMIFQEPMTSLNPVFTIGNQIAESLSLHRELGAEEIQQESINLLARTGIEDPENRLHAYPHQLSGGQRQRVMIAMALACRPVLLIADEPTTALDVSLQAKILDLIKGLQREYQMAMLLITHDLALVKNMADFICIMKDGSIIERGEPSKIFENPENSYTKKLIQSIPSKSKPAQGDSPPLLKTEHLSCSFAAESGFSRLFRRRRKPILAVDRVSLVIRKGSTCGIIGESGSGKTTLAMALLKLIKSDGVIAFDDIRLDTASTRELKQMRSRMQVVFQDPYSSLSPRMTVGEIVAEGLGVHRADLRKTEKKDMVAKALEDVGLAASIIQRYPHEFSGGQRQRIAIARVLILRPDLLILDEPTSALDMTIQAQILDLLNRLQEKFRLTYLFISHDLKVIRAIADDLIVMKQGRIVERGPADTLFRNPRDPYTRQLFQSAWYESYLTAPA